MTFKGMIAVAAVCAAGAFGQVALADPVTFTLTDPNQSGAVGSVLTFSGSLTNEAAPTATIVGDNFNGLPLSLTFDDTDFVVNFLGQEITGGSTLGPLPVFTVTIEDGTAPGVYGGVISAVFDSAGGSGQETNFQTFSVTVVPEAGTLGVLGLGVMGMVARKRRGGEAPRIY